MKKLRRNNQDDVLGGVLAGFADFFNIEAWIIRVIFFVIVLFFYNLGSFLVILYIALWIFMPEKESDTLKIKQDKK